jgi:hypothetical protein
VPTAIGNASLPNFEDAAGADPLPDDSAPNITTNIDRSGNNNSLQLAILKCALSDCLDVRIILE